MTTVATRSKIITLDVGGVLHKVSRDTLARCQGSMLASLISHHWKEGNTHSDEPIFIDRNGLLFQYIIDYLRTNKLLLPPSVSVSAVQQEFQFYGIPVNMNNVTEQYGHMYLRGLKKRIGHLKAELKPLEDEARSIQAAMFLENYSFQMRLPSVILVPREYSPFHMATLHKYLKLKGLKVTPPDGGIQSDYVLVEELVSESSESE